MKQLMAGGGVALIGIILVPLLADLFEVDTDTLSYVVIIVQHYIAA
jgi:hypothetical protein